MAMGKGALSVLFLHVYIGSYSLSSVPSQKKDSKFRTQTAILPYAVNVT